MKCYGCKNAEAEVQEVELKISFNGDQHNAIVLVLCDECVDKIDITEVWTMIKKTMINKVQ